MEEIKSSQLMNTLFAMNLPEILQKIFLYLDPISLKNCKLVNSNWCSFIDKNLWGSKTGRNELERRLASHLKDMENNPAKLSIDIGQEVMSLACDDEIAVLGYGGAKAGVLDLSSGEMMCQMDCEDVRSDDGGCAVTGVDIGQTVIAAVTHDGTVSVWDKNSVSLLYRAQHTFALINGYNNEYMCLSLASDNCLLTGARDGSLCVYQDMGDGWSLTKHVTENEECNKVDNKEWVRDIASDGNYSVVGTLGHVKLFNLQTLSFEVGLPNISVPVSMLAFSYPLVFIVGRFCGVQIWDVTTGRQVGETLQESRNFSHIHVNKYFLIVLSYDDDQPSLFLYKLHEVREGPVSDSKCWKKHIKIPEDGSVALSSNTTSLITSRHYNGWMENVYLSHNSVTVMDFWNHQQNTTMSDAAAPAPAKKAAKPKAPAAHPKYSVMIAAAISALKSPTGSSSQTILKYIVANHKVDAAKAATQVRLALKRGVVEGALKLDKATGKGARSFKVVKVENPKVKKAKKVVKKKPAAKKPKKAAKKAKKPAKEAAKKPAAKKAAKVPAAKKAAKKPAAKKFAPNKK